MSQGETGWGVFLMIWNGLFVGTLDNVLRPSLIKRGVKLPTVLIFLGVLGGVITFGIVGIFLGPVLLAVAYTLFQDWDREVQPEPVAEIDKTQCRAEHVGLSSD
jgi:predicted PurR-regulated permease PerM